ncbi:MAG TPA: hypothetical protein VGK04_01755 [Thermoanaerobaculia bacterium]
MCHPRIAVVLFVVMTMHGLHAGIWKTGDLPLGPVADIAAHPAIAGLVFASTSSGIYRSLDSGRHWQRVTDMPLHTISFVPVHALAFNPFNSDELCALGDSFGSCSTDLGTTWTSFPQPGITFLLFDPRVPDRLFMGTPYGSDWLYVSNDHGRSWVARGSLESHPWFHGAASIDTVSGAMFEDASAHGGCIPACGIYRSFDAGLIWQQVVSEEMAWTLAIDRARRSVLYTIIMDGTREVVSASTDGGTTWSVRGTMPLVNGSIHVLAADPRDVAILYAGFDGGMIFRSGDGGRTWSRIDQSELPADRITHITVGADTTVYAATSDRVFTLTGTRRRLVSAKRSSLGRLLLPFGPHPQRCIPCVVNADIEEEQRNRTDEIQRQRRPPVHDDARGEKKSVRDERQNHMPYPVLEHRSVSGLPARHEEDKAYVLKSGDARHRETETQTRRRLPGRGQKRSDQQNSAEVNDRRRRERPQLRLSTGSDLGAERDDDELQPGQSRSRRAEDDVKAFPFGERGHGAIISP